MGEEEVKTGSAPGTISGGDVPPGSDAKQERTWAMLCHLGTLVGLIIPFGTIIAPLVIWLIKKDGSALIDDQGKESLNFQITMTIAFIVLAGILMVIEFGFLLLVGLVIFGVVMVIIAGIKANNGEKYRYPVALRLIK